MSIQLQILQQENLPAFKHYLQEAFQKGAEAEYGELTEEILPESHIDASLRKDTCVAYVAMDGDELVGGAVVQIDTNTHHNHLDLLFVKYGVQSKGVGLAIWTALEQRYPDTKIWETGTPYFEKRNIHFYVNKCGFHIVEYYNEKHPEPHLPDMPDTGDIPGFEHGFFRFEKIMK